MEGRMSDLILFSQIIGVLFATCVASYFLTRGLVHAREEQEHEAYADPARPLPHIRREHIETVHRVANRTYHERYDAARRLAARATRERQALTAIRATSTHGGKTRAAQEARIIGRINGVR
jgi:hypothetical protein